MGRPPIGKRALTTAERQHRRRKKLAGHKTETVRKAETARDFLDRYGNLPMSALPLLKAIAVAREACLKSAQAVGERLAEPPHPNKKIRQVIRLAAQNGDTEAKLLLESGLLNMPERSSPWIATTGRPESGPATLGSLARPAPAQPERPSSPD